MAILLLLFYFVVWIKLIIPVISAIKGTAVYKKSFYCITKTSLRHISAFYIMKIET
jgi:hypothetical protein